MTTQRRALALLSGGLDSMLAVRVLQQQDILVDGINFYTGFCVEGHTHAIRKKDRAKPKRNNALWVAEQLGIRLHFADVVREFKDVVLNPKHGYGANLNPCLDCKIFMVRKAYERLKSVGYDFIVTGEVLGQRPKSQRKDTMPLIAAESGAGDLLLRPLCAKNLPPTLPERLGWVTRAKLHGFSGRNRKPQLALAAKLGIAEFAQPAGGCCFLTDARYAVRLADLWTSRRARDYDLDDIMLLKIGRHLRPAPHFKIIMSREEGEGRFLRGYRKHHVCIETMSHPGPLALIDGSPKDEDILLAAQLVGRFGKGRTAKKVMLELTRPGQDSVELMVEPFQSHEIPKSWYL